MKKAIIENQKVVNIIEYAGGRLSLPLNQMIVDCERYPVAIGDDCIDWRFYRDGTELLSEPTPEEQIMQLSGALIAAQQEITDRELAEIALGQTVTDLELMILEGM